MFAGFSLIGAALCSLVFLPHFISGQFFKTHAGETWLERISFSAFESNRYVVLIIFLATPVFLYFANDVSFNSDMSKLNFMEKDTRASQQRLEKLTQSSLTSLYVVSSGENLQSALMKNEQVMPLLQTLEAEKTINKFSSVSTFMVSDSLNGFGSTNGMNSGRPERISLNVIRNKGRELKFSDRVIQNFEHMISRSYTAGDTAVLNQIRAAFFEDYIIEKNGEATVISMINVDPSERHVVYDRLENSPVHSFDRQMLTNLFVEYVNADFNFIVTFTAAFVFIALLVLYGRIELTLITFVPMMITWIWILGIMALVE